MMMHSTSTFENFFLYLIKTRKVEVVGVIKKLKLIAVHREKSNYPKGYRAAHL